jgi:hypothetical protein
MVSSSNPENSGAQVPGGVFPRMGQPGTFPPMFMQQLIMPGMPPPLAVTHAGKAEVVDLEKKKRRCALQHQWFVPKQSVILSPSARSG